MIPCLPNRDQSHCIRIVLLILLRRWWKQQFYLYVLSLNNLILSFRYLNYSRILTWYWLFLEQPPIWWTRHILVWSRKWLRHRFECYRIWTILLLRKIIHHMNILWWIWIVNYQSTAWYRQHSKSNGFGLCIRCTNLGCWKVTIRCCRLMSGGSWRCWVLRWSRTIFLLMFVGRVLSWFWRWHRSWR